jgi:hypothetical protein
MLRKAYWLFPVQGQCPQLYHLPVLILRKRQAIQYKRYNKASSLKFFANLQEKDDLRNRYELWAMSYGLWAVGEKLKCADHARVVSSALRQTGIIVYRKYFVLSNSATIKLWLRRTLQRFIRF